MPAEQPDPIPRILMQIAYTHIEYCTTKNVDVFISDLIESAQYRSHHSRCHSCRPQALVTIPQRNVDQAKLAAIGMVLRFLFHLDLSKASSTNLVCTSP